MRIEHCTLVTPELVRRVKQRRAAAFAGYVYYHGEKMHFYGEQRLAHMFAMRDFLDAGIKAAPGSDYTRPAEPMQWLRSEVTRTNRTGHTWGANQRISVREAIRCQTLHGAGITPRSKRTSRGASAPGQAPTVVWDHDIVTIDPMQLLEVRPQRTMLGGRWVYEA